MEPAGASALNIVETLCAEEAGRLPVRLYRRMIEVVFASLLEGIAGLVFDKALRAAARRGKPRRPLPVGDGDAGNVPVGVGVRLGGELGERLLSSYASYLEGGDTAALEGFIADVGDDRDVVVALEFSREIGDDVSIQLGRSVEYTLSTVGQIPVQRFPRLAAEISYFIKIINAVHRAPRIHLLFSLPSALALQLGQHLGLSHYDIVPYHFEGGRYHRLPPPARESLRPVGEEA